MRGRIGLRTIGLVVTATLAVCLAMACGTAEARRARSTADPNIVDFSGLRSVHIGQTFTELRDNGTVRPSDACGPQFTQIESASPVFDSDRLVLLWAYPPLQTPEGIHVGSPVSEVRRVYPSAVELEPRPGTFPGLLVTDGLGDAYLILYDHGEVQKLIVGRESYARLLYTRGFGTC